MKMMFWGLLLLFFDFNLQLPPHVLSLLPDFVGTALIYMGMGKVAECSVYAKARIWPKAGSFYLALIWALNLLGMYTNPTLTLVLDTGAAVLELIVTYRMAQGVEELEAIHECDMYSRSLMTAWKVLVLWVVLVRVTAMLGVALLAVVALLASFVFMIYFMFRFHKSRKAYEECLRWKEEDHEASDLL